MLSQLYVAGEKFTVDASTSVCISFYLGAICKIVQPTTCLGGYLVFIVSRARCLSFSVPLSPIIMFCCRCRWYSTCSMSTGFRRWCNGWGLLLSSSFVFISVTFCIKSFCFFRFLSVEFTPGQIWKSRYLIWFKGCNTICGINRN